MTAFSMILLFLAIIPLGYLYLQAFASIRPLPKARIRPQPTHRFIIAIPAHDEEVVISNTVQRLRALDYPEELVAVHVVADHCSDSTANAAREAGAVVHERNDGPRTGKGAALSWFFKRTLASDSCDAFVIFDADTLVDQDFLRIMDARLASGSQVIQGQHVIRNPEAGWFPALTWAMFLVDNRFQNLGRSALGWSAKHMGDSICFHADVLRQIGWGSGLTEDYQMRQRLLLEGIVIAYEPTAIGRGEAAPTWEMARAQRARWLRGTVDASQQFATQLLREGIFKKNASLIDGALQAYLPSFSTLTMFAVAFLLLQLFVNLFAGVVFAWPIVAAWSVVVVALFIYPHFGLALERAPIRAYFAMMSGLPYVLWRTWLALTARISNREVVWVRTAHGDQR